MDNTIYNPCLPYVGPIPGGFLRDGMQIHVSGTPEQYHNGFLISLQAGGSIDPRSECAFVFNPRFTENQVVRNSLQGGSWGAEERHGGFPFRKGQPCNVTIHVKPFQYSVSVDGRHFCDYNHRVTKERVTHISVEQGIRVNNIRFDVQGGYPAGGYPPAGATGYPSPGGGPIYNPAMSENTPNIDLSSNTITVWSLDDKELFISRGNILSVTQPVPFEHRLGVYPNKMIFISGIPHPNPSRVTINLQCGRDIIAFHFDVRFQYGNDRNVIVRNAKRMNGWGQEERGLPGGYFPFQPNTQFEVIILAEPHCFKVAVNNQHLLEFNHRIQKLNRIDTLRITGDVRLTQVRFQG